MLQLFNNSLAYAALSYPIKGRVHFYDARNKDGEVECRIFQPVGSFICHVDDLDVSDSITVARASLGPWHSPLASSVL